MPRDNFRKSIIFPLANPDNPGTASGHGSLVSSQYPSGSWVFSQYGEISSPTESWNDLAPNIMARMIERLNNRVSSLEIEVAQIKKQANTVIIQIKNLYSEKLILKEPLNILLQDENGYFTATSLDLDLYGLGDSTQEAIKDLGENIEDIFFTFKAEGKNKLGSDMLKIWNFMRLVLKEDKNATKSRRGKKSL